MKNYLVRMITTLGLFAGFWMIAAAADAQAVDAALVQQVGAFLDEWHDDAARADLRYFDKIAPDGVYIGTDQSERWVRDDFKIWAKPFFERKKAWEFHAFNRHIAYSDDKSLVWFDEQLHTQMGICQASGIIRNTKDGFKIAHYQLSLTIPNALVKQIKADIDNYDANKK